jgi:hypothetical protein
MARPPSTKARPSVWLNYGDGVYDVAERRRSNRSPDGAQRNPGLTRNAIGLVAPYGKRRVLPKTLIKQVQTGLAAERVTPPVATPRKAQPPSTIVVDGLIDQY